MVSQRMTVSTSTNLDHDPYRLAIVAAERLRGALGAHGISVPSLRGSHPVWDTPFVELGGVSADVADALAGVLERVESR